MNSYPSKVMQSFLSLTHYTFNIWLGTDTMALKDTQRRLINSLTPKSVLAGTKNSRSKGFWLAEHKNTTIPTMMEPFPPPAAWFLWTNIPHPREPAKGKNQGKSSTLWYRRGECEVCRRHEVGAGEGRSCR